MKDHQVNYGREMKKFFYNRDDFINVNHGSYGSTPRQVLEKQHEYQVEMETACDIYFRVTAQKYYEQTRKAIGELVHCDFNCVALVENATSAVNSVLRSLPCLYDEEQTPITFLYFDIAYGMVKQVLHYLRDSFKHVNLLQVTLDQHCVSSHQNLLDRVENVLNENSDKRIVMAVFDHISSVPAIVFPVKKLNELFKKRNILTLVDGAHAVGQVPIDLQELNVDYYLSNCHKWLFAPKSCAFLYVREELKQQTRPACISFGYENRDFTFEYYWSGTRDLSAYFATVNAIEWRRKIGGEKQIMSYCDQLAKRVADLVSSIWNTSVLKTEESCALVNVEAPCQDKKKVEEIVNKLLHENQTYLHLFEFDGKFYARFSCQIYNEVTDYEQVARKVLQLAENYK